MITHTTLASIAKYPCESVASLGKKAMHYIAKNLDFSSQKKKLLSKLHKAVVCLKNRVIRLFTRDTLCMARGGGRRHLLQHHRF